MIHTPRYSAQRPGGKNKTTGNRGPTLKGICEAEGYYYYTLEDGMSTNGTKQINTLDLIVYDGQQADEYTPERIEVIRRTIAAGSTDEELALFIEQCRRTKLDPFARQIYSVRRKQYKDGQWQEAQVIQTSIDGYRVIADRSNEYAGQLGPFWCGPDGEWVEVWLKNEPPAAAKVSVLRHNFDAPVTRVALYKAYVQTNSQGQPLARWKTDPAGMLAKCAEALALRAAFPNDLSGLYTDAEMDQASNPPANITVTKVTPELTGGAPEIPEIVTGAFFDTDTVVMVTPEGSDENKLEDQPAAQVEAPAQAQAEANPWTGKPDPDNAANEPPAGLTEEEIKALDKELAGMTLEEAKALPDSRGGTYGAIDPEQLRYREGNMRKMLGKVDAEKEREYRRKLRAIALLKEASLKERESKAIAGLGFEVDGQPADKFAKYRNIAKQQDAPTAFWMLIKDAKWKTETAQALLKQHGQDFNAALEDLITRLSK